jgi:DNA-binding NtrC family response regulator
VLQERRFERVGGSEPIPFQARLVTATSRDLPAMIEQGVFRQDLYFRLAVSPIRLPPLREHREDIPAIAMHLLTRRAGELHSNVTAIERDALDLLGAYDWPGNVRELENALTRAIALARTPTLGAEDFAFLNPPPSPAPQVPDEPGPLWQTEKRAIERALEHTGRNITRTAELLDISRTTLRKKIRDYDIG